MYLIQTDKEALLLVADIKIQIEKLVALKQFLLIRPYLENLIENDIGDKIKPSPIRITENFRILLPYYNNMEIKMSHLTKAIYLFFLQNPKGVYLHHLPKYRNEILSLYKQISYKNSIESMEKSIDNVVNMKTKLIYVHFSRIKKAFSEKLPPVLARGYYIISDKKQGIKYINIDKALIIWE